MRKLELLAPAKNLACGLAAIDHGADAVYIGAEKFGARSAAGNSLDDIKTLCDYAHLFGARVYVTVNTIVYEEETDATQRLILNLAGAGVDAILVQDMATLRMREVAMGKLGYAPLLHASTQCDTRTPEKVEWLRALGFSRAVLARELSLQEIREIHEAVPEMELEVFVHGALCVSYSGLCYASQYCFGRSANRGACAQFCRMKFDLLDADGQAIERGKHLLSLKDMCRIDHLESLVAAGASSFKIEGRLKDVGYVKNVVSAYSQRLDALIAKHPDQYCRASRGRVDYGFEPNLKKTFNRGFTSYFLHGRQPEIASFDTPKALGEYVGNVKDVRRDALRVSGTASFSNGDGLCFLNSNHELEGFRVNRVVGNCLYPFKMPANLKPGTRLYRNNDEAFSKVLSGDTASRRLPIQMFLGMTDNGFQLRLTLKANGLGRETEAVSTLSFEHQTAQRPQEDNMRRQLTKLGNTPFACDRLEIDGEVARMFVPSSLLTELRREATDALASKIVASHQQEVRREQLRGGADGRRTEAKAWQPEYRRFPYLYNVSNTAAREFYATHGLPGVAPAFEIERGGKKQVLMQCKHCLRYSMGFCERHGGRKPTWHEPLSLRLGDGRRFRLEFNCGECQMNVYAE